MVFHDHPIMKAISVKWRLQSACFLHYPVLIIKGAIQANCSESVQSG